MVLLLGEGLQSHEFRSEHLKFEIVHRSRQWGVHNEHTDLGLREVAWAGDVHLGVIRKSHIHLYSTKTKHRLRREASKSGIES